MATVLLVIFSIGLIVAIILAITSTVAEVCTDVELRREAGKIENWCLIILGAGAAVGWPLLIVYTVARHC